MREREREHSPMLDCLAEFDTKLGIAIIWDGEWKPIGDVFEKFVAKFGFGMDKTIPYDKL